VFVWTILSMMVIAIILALPRARRSWHARAKRLEFDKMVAAFIAEIDNRVRAFELNPELPEIIELKAQAREIMAQAVKHRMRLDNLVLHDLNPYNDVVYTGSHLTIRERTFSHVLRSWSLVEFHIGRWASLDDYITRITVDRTGTHVFSHHMREVVNYHAGKLDPHRLNDPGNRPRPQLAGLLAALLGRVQQGRGRHVAGRVRPGASNGLLASTPPRGAHF
jgi:hypothetical protein